MCSQRSCGSVICHIYCASYMQGAVYVQLPGICTKCKRNQIGRTWGKLLRGCGWGKADVPLVWNATITALVTVFLSYEQEFTSSWKIRFFREFEMPGPNQQLQSGVTSLSFQTTDGVRRLTIFHLRLLNDFLNSLTSASCFSMTTSNGQVEISYITTWPRSVATLGRIKYISSAPLKAV